MSQLENNSMMKNRWVILFAMCLGIACINAIPYSIRSYYVVFQEAMGMTNGQLGQLMSAYGIVSLVLYFPGGWLCDKFSPRKLLTLGFLLGGGLSMAILTFPSFPIMCVIFALFAVSCNMLGWGAYIKITTYLGGKGQAKFLGASEAMLSIIGMSIGMLILWIGTFFTSSKETYTFFLLLYGGASLIAAVLVWFMLKEDQLKNLQSGAVDLSYIGTVVKMPKVWLMALVIICCYCAYSATSYLSPYLVEAYGTSTEMSSVFGLLHSYGFRIIACPIFGLLADRGGSATKILTVFSGVIAAIAAAYLIVPGVPETYLLGIGLMCMWGLVASGMRGLYYAQMKDANIPTHMQGTAIGFIALLAYMPDTFFYTMVGDWIDAGGVAGYHNMFTFSLVMCAVAIVGGLVLIAMNKKTKATA